ncbi:hypothetical protein C1645_777538, partial [Glomus cerebriforme]
MYCVVKIVFIFDFTFLLLVRILFSFIFSIFSIFSIIYIESLVLGFLLGLAQKFFF